VQNTYENVTEISLDRETRKLTLVADGTRLVVDGIDRLYVRSLAWSEAGGTVHMSKGRVSVNGNIAAAID
jgi:hypothetical protein